MLSEEETTFTAAGPESGDETAVVAASSFSGHLHLYGELLHLIFIAIVNVSLLSFKNQSNLISNQPVYLPAEAAEAAEAAEPQG